MLKPKPNYSDQMQQLFREQTPDGNFKKIINCTFQVTEDCSLRCTYCYQPTKVHKYMTFDVAKRAIDQILESAEHDSTSVFSYDRTLGIIIDFIGGEPLLNMPVVRSIIDYFEDELIKRNSPWLYFHRYSFSSNGVAFFNPEVQDMIDAYGDLISMNITIDGNKELHDSCRVFPDGTGSYDIAIKAALYLKEKYKQTGTKITIAPENLDYINEAMQNMLNLGYEYIHANCVFEDVWSVSDATKFYYKLKELADYLLDTDWDQKCFISLFDDRYFRPYTGEDDDRNWCGGTGAMVAIDCDGNYYPCVRYLPNSVGFKQKPYTIGNLDDGLYTTEKDKATRAFLESITRSSQSTEECNTCPIAKGCAWCSGHNYMCFGTPNKRATFICPMHKARALANLYYYKQEAKKYNKECTFENHITDQIALEIIPQEEWDLIK